MKQLTFLILVFFSLQIIEGVAQDSKPLSEVRKNDYQVELGFRSVESIWKNTSSATVIFKKSYKTGELINVNSVNYMRAYFSINTQINFSEDPARMDMDSTEIGFHPGDIIDVTSGIGIEKQFHNKKFVHYIGTDLYTRFFKSDDDFPNNTTIGDVSLNFTQTTDRTIRSLNLGLSPFFGIKYYFTNQFSVGIESGFRISYFNTRIQEIRIETEFDPFFNQTITVFKELDPVISNGFKFNFLGIRFITLGYSF